MRLESEVHVRKKTLYYTAQLNLDPNRIFPYARSRGEDTHLLQLRVESKRHGRLERSSTGQGRARERCQVTRSGCGGTRRIIHAQGVAGQGPGCKVIMNDYGHWYMVQRICMCPTVIP